MSGSGTECPLAKRSSKAGFPGNQGPFWGRRGLNLLQYAGLPGKPKSRHEKPNNQVFRGFPGCRLLFILRYWGNPVHLSVPGGTRIRMIFETGYT